MAHDTAHDTAHDPAPEAAVGPCAPLTDAEIDGTAETLQVPGAVPGGGPRLLAQLMDPDMGIDELASRLAAEPALAIRVLRVANSPFYGQAGQVSSLARAAQILGVRALRGVAAAGCFDGLTRPGKRGDSPDLAALRQHSLATACAAQALAQRVAPGLAEQAFIAGLLHDVGLLVLWRLRPQAMRGLARQAAIGQAATEQAVLEMAGEAEALGTTHAHCGARVLAAWHLPATLSRVVAAHHAVLDFRAGNPGSGTGATSSDDLGRILALGEALGQALGQAQGHAAGAAAATQAGTPADAGPPPSVAPADAPWAQACAEVVQALPGIVQRMAAVMAD